MLSEETINKILSLSKQKHRRNVWILKLLIIISGILCWGILYGLLVFWKDYNWININSFVSFLKCILLFILLIMPIVFMILIDYIKVEKREYNRVKLFLTDKSEDNSFFMRGDILTDYGFYEEALDDYNSGLRELEKAAEQTAESLQKFFEEYNTMTKVVNGIYRPVPNFRNYNLPSWSYCYQARKNCLEKLERYDEAKADEEKLKTIAILTEENNNLTEKYWKGHWGSYGNYD
jgi:tetratricopeptide (TPR) repeat protein